MENPWKIQSIYELQYFNCPTCNFKDNSKQEFINHAYEFHKESIDFLMKIDDNSLSDITCPWTEIKEILTKIKKEEPDNDPVFAETLENSALYEVKTEILEDSESEIKPEYDFDENINDGLPDPLNIEMANSDYNFLHDEYDKIKPKCDICGKHFSSKWNLRQHKEIVHEGKKLFKFKCDRCEKSFTRPHHLNKHVDTVHKNKKIYNCDLCEKSFGEMGNLQKHVKNIHEEQKNIECYHNCEMCGKDFLSKGSLKSHKETVHEGKNQVKCEICGKLFTQSGSLKKHIQSIHEGMDSYKCELCDKVFNQIQNLRKHIKSIHEKVRYECEKCGKSFSRSDTLKSHMLKCSP